MSPLDPGPLSIGTSQVLVLTNNVVGGAPGFFLDKASQQEAKEAESPQKQENGWEIDLDGAS